jgi:hypothetical protein
MRRAWIIIVICGLIVFVAGVGVGAVLTATRTPAQVRRGSFLAHELNLTPAQQEQIRQVWSQVVQHEAHLDAEPRRVLEQEHEQATLGLLTTPEQLCAYAYLGQQYSEELAASVRELQRKQQQDTLALLTTPEQVYEYEHLNSEYERKLAGLAQERQAMFDQAVEQTRAILDPAQRQKYDQLLQNKDLAHGAY